ncbi:MAG: hypothetical protein WAN51_09030 [Alphaproteobacteria bacterium]
MSKTPEELLAMQFGGATVADNLKRAIESGELIEHDDGTLELPPHPKNQAANWMRVPNGPPLGCEFLMQVAFFKAYAKSAVPCGCRNCYKVKVAPRTLRELVAAWQVAKSIECRSKWGVDFFNSHSQDVYAGYFYANGLDGARVVFKLVSEAFAADPKLGLDIPMRIKRGCSNYEAAVGPSDRYEFTPEMAELEAYLKSKFRPRRNTDYLNAGLAYWIEFAFLMGDDTYLDFTGGKRLRPKTVTYDP